MNIFGPKDKLFDKRELKVVEILQKSWKRLKGEYPTSKVYLYGGFLRDKFLGQYSCDMDIMVSEQIAYEFIEFIKEQFFYLDCREHHLSEEPKKGEVYYSIFFEDLGIRLGITLLRGSILEEMKKKDFTINALSYDLTTNLLVINSVTKQALKDLKLGIIKCVQSPKITFQFSPSRIFRFLRFYVKYNFQLDPEIIKYLNENDNFQDKKFYNYSMWCQYKKLLRTLKMYPEKIYIILKILWYFKILDKLQIYTDFENSRFVFLVTQIKYIDICQLYDFTKNEDLVPFEDYYTINLNLQYLARCFKFFIKLKKGNIYFKNNMQKKIKK